MSLLARPFWECCSTGIHGQKFMFRNRLVILVFNRDVPSRICRILGINAVRCYETVRWDTSEIRFRLERVALLDRYKYDHNLVSLPIMINCPMRCSTTLEEPAVLVESVVSYGPMMSNGPPNWRKCCPPARWLPSVLTPLPISGSCKNT